MKQRVHRLIAAAICFVVGALVAPVVPAQPAATAPHRSVEVAPGRKAGKSARPPSDAELKHFVDAALQMRVVGAKAQAEVKAAKTDAERDRIRRSTEATMEKIVRRNRLTVHRYEEIFLAMRDREEVRRKVRKLVEQKQGSPTASPRS